MHTLNTFWFLLRYGIVGVTGGVLQTLTLYVWVSVFNMERHYLLGAVIGFCIALAVTFTLQKYWTFGERTRSETKRQFLIYTSIALVNLAGTLLLLHLSKILLERAGFDFFNTWYLIIQVLIVVCLAAASFVLNYFITFRVSPPTDNDTQIVSDTGA